MKTNRRIVQAAFLILVLVGVFVVKGNAERWCPFGGVEAIYNYCTEGNMLCSLGVSNLYILAAVLVMTLLLRRAFCGYVCPIGTLSRLLRWFGDKMGIKPVKVTGKADFLLGLLKYAVLVLILYITWHAAELHFRAADPCYAILSRHGEDITFWAYVVLGAILLGSLFIMMPFCRWFCPLAAVLSPFSKVGLTRITRHEEPCINCGKCARVCPTAIDVDKVKQVTAARCLSCMDCVDACPAGEYGALTWGPPRTRWPQTALIVLLLVCLAGAVCATYFAPVPSFTYQRGVAPAQTAQADLMVSGLTCRGAGSQLKLFLDREDIYELPGYLKLEAWPGPGAVRVLITYDPTQIDETDIKDAIIEPYYYPVDGYWRSSPFTIVGYDPLMIE